VKKEFIGLEIPRISAHLAIRNYIRAKNDPLIAPVGR